MNLKKARTEYSTQKAQAKLRGIGWQMSFDEWCDIWLKSGWYDRRGPHKWEFVMCRFGDKGPYHPDNVEIRTSQSNIREAWFVINRERGNHQIAINESEYDVDELEYWEEWGQYLS